MQILHAHLPFLSIYGKKAFHNSWFSAKPSRVYLVAKYLLHPTALVSMLLCPTSLPSSLQPKAAQHPIATTHTTPTSFCTLTRNSTQVFSLADNGSGCSATRLLASGRLELQPGWTPWCLVWSLPTITNSSATSTFLTLNSVSRKTHTMRNIWVGTLRVPPGSCFRAVSSIHGAAQVSLLSSDREDRWSALLKFQSSLFQEESTHRICPTLMLHLRSPRFKSRRLPR